ncbi:MAG: MoaD/ThiS family protein [Planctomycetota bacterium]
MSAGPAGGQTPAPDAVRVRVASILHKYTGGASELLAAGRTLRAVLSDLERRHRGFRFRIVDEQDRIRPHIKVYVAGRPARDLGAPLAPGDEVHVL